jgi:NADH:ubiquinone oxidoreductase subunit 6 (subunit J)
MAEVIFFIAAIVVLAGAVGTVSLSNPFFAVLSLVCHLLALAALFLLLRAEFLAAAQVIIYVGAVMVLYLFVVAYVGGQEQPLGPSRGAGLRGASLLFAGVLVVELLIAILGSGLSAIGSDGARVGSAFGTAAQIGRLLLTKFLLAFELASILLLVAAVGAVILARRRSGLEQPGELSVADLVRSPTRGTFTEAPRKGTLTEAPAETMAEAGGPPHR